MSIEIKCGSCAKRFRVADRYAGKRVKCSNCSAPITVPEPLPTHETRFGPVSESELNSDLLTERDSIIEPPIGDLPPPMRTSGFEAAYRAARSRTQPRKFRILDYRGAAAAYAILPWAIGLICLVPIIVRGAQVAMVSDPMWVFVTEFSLTLLLYLVLIVPLTTHSLRIAGRMMHVELPGFLLGRTLGLFALPFSLGAIFFWQLGVPGLIFGSLLGILLIGPLLAMVFQLHWVETAVAWMMSALFFSLTAAATVGMMFIAGLIITGSMASNEPAKKPAVVKHPIQETPTTRKSPSVAAAGTTPSTMPVATTVTPATQPDELAGFVSITPPTTSTKLPGAGGTAGAVTPVPPKRLAPPVDNRPIKIAPSPIVTSATILDWVGSIETILPPGADSTLPSVLKRTADLEAVMTLDVRQGRLARELRFRRDTQADDQYAVMNNGGAVVRITTWPRLRLEIISGDVPGPSKGLILDDKIGQPAMVGISTNQMLLLRRQLGSQHMIETWNLRAGVQGRVTKTSTLFPNSATISPDGKAVAVAAKVDELVQLVLIEPGRARKFTIKLFDPRWPVEPAGVAYSADGTRVAVCFEHDGGMLVAAWNVITGKPYEEHIFPPGTFPLETHKDYRGSAVEWLPDDETYVLFGKSVVDATTGTAIGSTGIETTVGQRLLDSTGFLVLAMTKTGERQLVLIDFDLDAIARTRPTTKPAAK